ncbi:aldose epimerase family protein [Spongisporangium articulatum]|uniref:Aldose 1-epimerase n=1 Tax=Spongisporangium articulatum TaxID=3362603 RepID=A0ABW8AJ97_9ACTN
MATVGAELFGHTEAGQAVHRWRLDDGELAIGVLDLGAIVHTLEVPDRNGVRADVVVGFDSPAGYLTEPPMYAGAVVGRYANRIADGVFAVDGRTYEIPPNEGPNVLHGGRDGFHRRMWNVEGFGEAGLRCVLISPDGDQGFPGELTVEVTYELLPGRRVRIDYRATSDRPTVLNLTQHTYFALDGTGEHGPDSNEEHLLQVPARAYTPTGPGQIPTGTIESVEGTPLDLRQARRIGDVVKALEAVGRPGGVDHNFVLGPTLPATGTLRPAGTLSAPGSGRRLDVFTNQPAVQVFTASAQEGPWIGKGAVPIGPASGVCLETQHYPDAPNQEHFPSTRLDPGQVFDSVTEWRFSAV